MREFSFFHQEVVSFLQIGAPPSKLDEILENYRHLIGEPSFIHLDQQWLSSFSQKEFAELQLFDYFPKVYRGLPRLYNRHMPSQSKIKPNFTNLYALKRLTIDQALYSLYSGIDILENTRISIVTWVIPDGLGDWSAAIETAKILREKWAKIQVDLLFVTPMNLPSSSEFATTQIFYQNEPSLKDFPFDVLKSLRESDLILQIPTFFPLTKQLLEKIQEMASTKVMPMMKNIGEYGALESSWFHPKSHNVSMGLHALEKGIFVYPTSKPNFAKLEQANLKTWLFGTTEPTPQDIQIYLERHNFHLAYLATPIGGAIYLHSLIKMHEKNVLDIDVCCPNLTWLSKWHEMQTPNHFLHESVKLRAVEIFTPENRCMIKMQESGKVLRIFCPGPLSQTDMKNLFALSHEWVAVRGNQSFSEAVSHNKTFFYDGRHHNKYFMKDLMALAQNHLVSNQSALDAFRWMKEAYLWNLQEDTSEWIEEISFQQMEKMDWFFISQHLGESLQDPETILGFHRVCERIKKEHSFHPFLTHLVQRALCFAKHPSIRQMEALQMNLYLHGRASFSTLVQRLTKEIAWT